MAQILKAGAEINGDTLSRFYSIHMLVLPGAIFALIGIHLYLVIRLGVSNPPWGPQAGGHGGGRGARSRGARAAGAERKREVSASVSIEDNRRHFEAYKKDVEKNGKSFFPHAMFHDTVMSLVVVSVIIGLAVVWHETANGTDAGILGPEYAEKADPGTTSFIPRPDWYFYFLFYLLRIFKWPNTVVLATVGIPTVLMMLLFALPFIDRRPERRLVAPAGGDRGRDPRRAVDGHPHVEGRDRERVPRERGVDDGQGHAEAEQPPRCGAARVRSCSPSRAASTATRI